MTTEEEKFEEEFNAWLADMEKQIEVTQESEILTAEDYNIIINVVQQ